jgi:hypothetical protein
MRVRGFLTSTATPRLPPNAEIAPDDPFFAFQHFSAFMQQAVFAVPVKQRHADRKFRD